MTRDVDKARQESKAHTAFYITNMGDYYREQLIRMGHEEAVAVVRHAWEEGGHAAGIAAVPDALVDGLFFAGPAEACVERWKRRQKRVLSCIRSMWLWMTRTRLPGAWRSS